MTDDNAPRKPPRIWPGMPTRGSQFIESLFVMFPIWIGFIGFALILTLVLLQSCRDLARNQAGQAPPLNVEERAAP